MVGFVFFPVTSARKFILVDKPIWWVTVCLDWAMRLSWDSRIHFGGRKQAWRLCRNFGCPTENVVSQFEILLFCGICRMNWLACAWSACNFSSSKGKFVCNRPEKELFNSWCPFSCICYTIIIRACILGLRRGYLIDLLISEPNQGSLDIDCQKAVTAICSSIIFLCSSSIMTSRHHTSAGTAPHLSFVKSICEVQLGISADTSEEPPWGTQAYLLAYTLRCIWLTGKLGG